MDALESLDWGTYAHFRFQAQQLGLQAKNFPDLAQSMQDYYFLAIYLTFAVLILTAALLFLTQKRQRAALVVVLTAGAAIALIEGVRFVVPRQRPPDAQNWLGAHQMLGSYPSEAVFLFLLSLILVGVAGRGFVRSWWMRGGYSLLAALFAGAVCMSQFFLALHFLTDIIGGIVGAVLFALIATRFLDKPAGTNDQTVQCRPPS